jgi:thiamine pyrophosphokinase
LIQPSYGEPDQFMGNFMLLTLTDRLVGGYNPQLRILNTRYEIVFLDNVRKIIDNAVGDTVSVLPLSQEVTYTCRGTAYDVREFTIERGFSVGLRNRITAQNAVFDIAGQAFLIRVHAGAFDQKGA